MDVHAAEGPDHVRQAVLRRMQSGDQLWRCPRLPAPRGLFGVFSVGRREVVVEWWPISADGDLIVAFWQQ